MKPVLLNPIDTKIIKTLGQSLWPKHDWITRRKVLKASTLLAGSKLINIQAPRIFKHVVDSLNLLDPKNPTHFLAPTLSPSVLALSTLGYCAAKIGAGIMNESKNVILGKISQNATNSISVDFYKNLLTQDHEFFGNIRIGQLVKNLDRGSRSIHYIMSNVIFHLIPTFLESALVSAIIWNSYGATYGLVTVGTMGCYSIYTILLTKWRTQIRAKMNKYDNNASALATDALINHETIKIFNTNTTEVSKYAHELSNYHKEANKTTWSLFLLNAGQLSIFTLGASSLLLMGIFDVLNGIQTIGDLVMVNSLLYQLQTPLNFLGSVYREFRRSLVDAHEFFTLLAKSPKTMLSLPSGPVPLKSNVPLPVVFDNISFGYGKKPLIKNLSLTLPPFTSIALIGPSGSGKSTIARLLLKHYVGSIEGKITLGGVNINHYSQDSLRDHIKLVPQELPLLHRSISDNIRYSHPEATYEEVAIAAKKAHLHHTVLKMPQQYNTIVGERGSRLSGGERQRVRLAQIFLKPPPVIIFDESTSALDPFTESKVCEEICKLNSSIIFITHRLHLAKYFSKTISLYPDSPSK